MLRHPMLSSSAKEKSRAIPPLCSDAMSAAHTASSLEGPRGGAGGTRRERGRGGGGDEDAEVGRPTLSVGRRSRTIDNFAGWMDRTARAVT